MESNKQSLILHLKKSVKFSLNVFGFFAVFFLALSFTDIPYLAYHQLGQTNRVSLNNNDYIILLGGDGMPSPSGLIRCYYTADAAKKSPNAKIIIALPYNQKDSLFQLNLMAIELISKGIHKNRIIYEPTGYNTISQASAISKMITNKSSKLLVVTSPDHMYRSIKCFEKMGFNSVFSMPTFELPSDEIKLKGKKTDKDKRLENLSLRYNMWSYMVYEIKVIREYFAITYYWLMGWI